MRFSAGLQILLLIAAVGIGAYVYRTQVKVFAAQAINEISPCSVPVTYSIGSIDPRFGISTSSLVRAMTAATDVWDKAAGKTLFIYESEGGALTVDLVYDQRQATTNQLDTIGSKLSNSASSYDSVKAAYQSALSTYNTKKQSFDTHYASYTTRSAAYEREVQKWNDRGGAPQDVYDSLQAEKAQLNQEGDALESLQSEVNADAEQVNALVPQLNALAKAVNADAATYNTVGRATGAEFEEAVFTSAPGRENIAVYEYDSMARLTRVLAHEFGHSIGLEHVEDPDAIMYRLNKGTQTVTTPADVQELDSVCSLT